MTVGVWYVRKHNLHHIFLKLTVSVYFRISTKSLYGAYTYARTTLSGLPPPLVPISALHNRNVKILNKSCRMSETIYYTLWNFGTLDQRGAWALTQLPFQSFKGPAINGSMLSRQWHYSFARVQKAKVPRAKLIQYKSTQSDHIKQDSYSVIRIIYAKVRCVGLIW